MSTGTRDGADFSGEGKRSDKEGFVRRGRVELLFMMWVFKERVGCFRRQEVNSYVLRGGFTAYLLDFM